LKDLLKKFRLFNDSFKNRADFNNAVSGFRSFAYRIKTINFSFLLNNFNAEDYFYWSVSDNKLSLLGIKSVFDIKINGLDRIEKTDSKILQIENNVENNWHEVGLNFPPMFLGGMKFVPNEQGNVWNDFSDSDWMLPKFLFYKSNSDNFLVINYKLSSLNDSTLENEILEITDFLTQTPNPAEQKNIQITSTIIHNGWNDKVLNALKSIHEGAIQKIVLSREVEWELSGEPNIYSLIQKLGERYPKCYVFAFRRNNSVFFGASPEKLAKIQDGWIETDALAGSISRSSNLEEDLKLENELLSSEKNLNEQDAVVKFITGSLSKISDDIEFNEKPIIRKLPNIQHLWTPIRAKLNKELKLFSILKNLHPTPAICGAPWLNALKSITRMEEHDRGLYAGIVGWFCLENKAEFAVAIRSALLKDKKVYGYAGCGIVEGSDPDAEYEETELKLKPIKNLFVNEKSRQS